MTFRFFAAQLLALAVSVAPGAGQSIPAEVPGKQAAPKKDPAPWLSTLSDGSDHAQRHRQPILVYIRAETCEWCRKLDEVVNQAKVQQELDRWTLIALDREKSPRESKAFAVVATPALRIVTMRGREVAHQDGYLTEEKLLAWLRENYETAAAAPAEELLSEGAPDVFALARLVDQLKLRDPVFREAAIRRLLPHPAEVRSAIVEAFIKGPLQTRLSAQELFQAWKAPAAGLDPWRPESLTPARLKSLQEWAANPAQFDTKQPQPLTPEQLQSSREEIARMLRGTEGEVAAVRERLVRHGPALMPEVHAQLKAAATDQARERLTALRYRLVSSSELALNWPGGLERLAATSTFTSQKAAQELAERVTAEDEPLLLELFTNADPLVREISLRALQSVMGTKASAALTKLLSDPEPNVRAAVLKQLVEQPAASMVPPVVEYVAAETDADLLVHAVRVLGAVKGKAAYECLMRLLQHESWRVRAEAAEALGKYLSDHSDGMEDAQADICVALIRLLDDPDGFVVSRAIPSLSKADLALVVDPLAEVAGKHPDLAAEVMRTISYSRSGRAKALPHLRKFCAHDDPETRAAAVRGLIHCVLSGVEPSSRIESYRGGVDSRRGSLPADLGVASELKNALQDKASPTRQAAAEMILEILRTRRSLELADPTAKESEEWLEKSRTGKTLPQWLADFSEMLPSQLVAAEPKERLAAALAMIALAQEEKGAPVLLEAARADHSLQANAAEALTWLPWVKRQDLFLKLLELQPDHDTQRQIFYRFVPATDTEEMRAVPLLWDLAAKETVTEESASILQGALSTAYFGYSRSGREKASHVLREEAVARAKKEADAGPDLKRLIALAFLVDLSPADAGDTAERVVLDSKAGGALRRDAFQILLLSRSDSKRGVQTALDALSNPDADMRRVALTSLTMGAGRLSALRGGILTVRSDPRWLSMQMDSRSNEIIEVNPPEGLTLEKIRPLLKDPDPESAALAGYLLATLGDPSGLDLLLRYWREHAHADEDWIRLVYRAVAALGDDGRVSLLEKIYGGFRQDEHYQLREFYWTIRAIDGPNALKLRKQIRKEVGMDNLR